MDRFNQYLHLRGKEYLKYIMNSYLIQILMGKEYEQVIHRKININGL